MSVVERILNIYVLYYVLLANIFLFYVFHALYYSNLSQFCTVVFEANIAILC